MNLHVRDLPDSVHTILVERARRRGMSLRQYTIEVLEAHCDLPTTDEWLDGLAELEPTSAGVSGADAVRAARAADDEKITRADHTSS